MYIDPDLISDETSVAEAVLAGIADRINAALDLAEDEQWEAQDGSPEASLGEAVGVVIATAASMIKDQERTDYAGFGELILRVPRLRAEPATGYSRWTFSEPGDYLIPDGSEMVVDAPDGTPVAYAVVGDVSVVAAEEATDVEVVAIEPGSVANGLLGPARDWEPLSFLTGVEMTTAPANGTDEQTRDEYLEVITRRSRRMKLVPIVTDDYADTALDNPNVAAAVAVRLLDLDNPTDPPAAGGHVTVFVKGFAGEDLPLAVKDEVLDSMMGIDRPLAVTVHVGDFERTDVTVAVIFTLAEGADHDATVGLVESTIAGALDPAAYGADDEAPGKHRAPRDAAEREINRYDIVALIDDLPGVEKITNVTVNGASAVTLAGWAPVPNLTSVTATVA
jgi:hypothetical protein